MSRSQLLKIQHGPAVAPMPALWDKPILIFDIHKTLFHEAYEFPYALDAAIKVWIRNVNKVRKSKGLPALSEKGAKELYINILKDMGIANRTYLRDDWDNQVFERQYMPALVEAFGVGGISDEAYRICKEEAIQTRREVSRQRMEQYAYKKAIKFAKKREAAGDIIIGLTDANASCVVDVLPGLGLEDVFHAVYAGKSSSNSVPQVPRQGKIKQLPEGMFKPNAWIMGKILLDLALDEGLVPEGTTFSEVFELVTPEDKLGAFRKNSAGAGSPYDGPRFPYTQLCVKEGGLYEGLFRSMLQCTVVIGDGIHRDMLLAHNAGIFPCYVTYCDTPFESEEKAPKPSVARAIIEDAHARGAHIQQQEQCNEIIDIISFWHNAPYAEIPNEMQEQKGADIPIQPGRLPAMDRLSLDSGKHTLDKEKIKRAIPHLRILEREEDIEEIPRWLLEKRRKSHAVQKPMPVIRVGGAGL